LSGRGLCDELITHPEESYRLCCVVVCDLETSRMGAPYIYDISHLRVNFGYELSICSGTEKNHGKTFDRVGQTQDLLDAYLLLVSCPAGEYTKPGDSPCM